MNFILMHFLIILSAVIIDLIFGDPYWLPHPVRLMGWLISVEEKVVRNFATSKLALKLAGFFIVFINLILGFSIPFIIMLLLKPFPVFYFLVGTVLCYTCLACKCLYIEAIKVVSAFDIDLNSARKQLGNIVGRETDKLSEQSVLMAVTETIAENTSDGVIAPLFFMCVGGAPFALAYKFINTMDSMLGYKNEQYIDLGFFAAKVDDIANYIPARLCALFMIVSSVFQFNVKNGFKILMRDSKKHSSPNAGFPESAVAGLLGVRLGGPNYYSGKLVEKPFIGNADKPIEKQDIYSAIRIMTSTEILSVIVFGIIYFYIFF